MSLLGDVINRIIDGPQTSSALPPSPFDYHNELGMMFLSALLGAIAGAIVGGVIQTLLMMFEHRHARRTAKNEFDQRKKEEAASQLEQERSLALKTTVKASRTSNRLLSVLHAWAEQLEESQQLGNTTTVLWQRLYPVSGLPHDLISYDVDEIAFVLKIGEDELANDMLLISEKYASFMDSLIEYNRKRSEMKERTIIHVQNRVGVSVMDFESMIKLTPYLQELVDLAEQLCDALAEDLKFAASLYDRLGIAFEKYFQRKAFSKATPSSVFERLANFEALAAEAQKVEGNGFTGVPPGDPFLYLWVPSYEEMFVRFDNYRPFSFQANAGGTGDDDSASSE